MFRPIAISFEPLWDATAKNLTYRPKFAPCAIARLRGAKSGKSAGMRSSTVPIAVAVAVLKPSDTVGGVGEERRKQGRI